MVYMLTYTPNVSIYTIHGSYGIGKLLSLNLEMPGTVERGGPYDIQGWDDVSWKRWKCVRRAGNPQRPAGQNDGQNRRTIFFFGTCADAYFQVKKQTLQCHYMMPKKKSMGPA